MALGAAAGDDDPRTDLGRCAGHCFGRQGGGDLVLMMQTRTADQDQHGPEGEGDAEQYAD